MAIRKDRSGDSHVFGFKRLHKDHGTCVDPLGCQDSRCPGGEICLWSCGYADCKKCKRNGTVNTDRRYSDILKQKRRK